MTVTLQTAQQAVLQKIHDVELVPFSLGAAQSLTSSGVTIHDAIRLSLGLSPDDSFFMYWEWQEIESFLREWWQSLDDSASKVAGRQVSLVAHCFDESMDIEFVIESVRTAKFGTEHHLSTVTRRPCRSESQVRFKGKLMGACLQTIGILERRLDSGFGDLFASLTDVPRTDRELLQHLDELCGVQSGDHSALLAARSGIILRALGWAFEVFNSERSDLNQPRMSLSEFIIATDSTNNWAGLSDQALLRRLLAIAPEKAEAQQRAIATFLAE